jgi:polar amino acid transport system substrate-binding protein
MKLRYRALLIAVCASPQPTLALDLQVVTGDYYAPFTGIDLPGGGLATLLVKAALGEAEVASALSWEPWKRGYKSTLDGRYDATYPYVRTADRETEYLYSEPLITLTEHVFSRRADGFEIADLNRVAGRTLCMPLGWQPPPIIQDLLSSGQTSLIEPRGVGECVSLVLKGRADLFVAGQMITDYALAIHADPEAKRALYRSLESLSTRTLHLIVPRKHPQAQAIISAFNQGLARLNDSGCYEHLVTSYLHRRRSQDIKSDHCDAFFQFAGAEEAHRGSGRYTAD